MNPQARRIFRDRYGSDRNVMTPILHDYRMRGQYAVEVSSSPDQSQWGVTVLRLDGSRCDLSQAFSTRHEADAYVASLRTKP